MEDCQKYHGLIEKEIDGTLDATGTRELERHAKACEACTRDRKDATVSRESFATLGLAEVPGTASQSLETRLARLYEEEHGKGGASWLDKLALLFARPSTAALGAAALACVFFLVLWPQGPAPTTVNVSSLARRSGSPDRSACSKALRIRPRNSSASSIDFMPGANSAKWSLPKYDWPAPAATIITTNGTRSMSGAVLWGWSCSMHMARRCCTASRCL